MRSLLSSISIVALLFLGSCGGSESAQENATSEPKMNVAEMQEPSTLTAEISGMMCPNGCAAVIQKEVYALDGIATSTVDFDSKTGTFEYDAAVISESEIIAAIEKVNKGAYKAETSKPDANEAEPASDVEAVEETTSEDEASV